MPQQMWSKRRRGTSLPPGRPQETPPHLSRTLTFPAPTPPTTRAWLKTTRTLAAIPLIGPSAGASMRATTSIWSAPHLGAILWVIALHIYFLSQLFNNSALMVWRAYFEKRCSRRSKPVKIMNCDSRLKQSLTRYCFLNVFSLYRTFNWETRATFLHFWLSSVP